MNSYLLKNFPDLKVQKPLFYSWPIGLRFEIGLDEIEYSDEYFEVALKRAVSIFESIFESIFDEKDELEIILQQYSDGRRKIRKGNFIFKQIKLIESREVKHSDIRDIYELDFKSACWKRVNISGLSSKDINYKNILHSLINTDFFLRKPEVSGECYFINRTKNIMLNLYDDRGMDVISSKKETLFPLYKLHNDWLLNHDRSQMDSVFS